MPKKESPLDNLAGYLPPGSYELVAPYFSQHVVQLTLTRERKSVLGDYRTPSKTHPFHRITVNINLNPYSFLITLLHELAHMLVFQHFGVKASPHGREWKVQFRHVLMPFMGKAFFPKDVERALMAYLHNPAASTCTDPNLFKALYKYDEQKEGYLLMDELDAGAYFGTDDGRQYQKIERLRTRSRCVCLRSGRVYLFQGIIPVKQSAGPAKKRA